MEMMVVLLIISVIAAFGAPIISKKMLKSSAEKSPWVYAPGGSGNIFFKTADKSTASIGAANPVFLNNTSTSSTHKARLYINSGFGGVPQISLGSSADITKPFKIAYAFDTLWMSTHRPLISPNSQNSIILGAGSHVKGPSYRDILAIGPNVVVENDSNNNVAIGTGAKMASYNSIAIGASANAYSNNSIAIGTGAQTKSWGALALGEGAISTGGVTIGRGSSTVDGSSVALGLNAKTLGSSSIALGNDSVAYYESVAVGDGACAADFYERYDGTRGGYYSAWESVALGAGAVTRDDSSVAIGKDAEVEDYDSVAIGKGAFVEEDSSVAIGKGAITGDYWDVVAIGNGAQANYYQAIAIGKGVIANGERTLALGADETTIDMLGDLEVRGDLEVKGKIFIDDREVCAQEVPVSDRDNATLLYFSSDKSLKYVGEYFKEGFEHIKSIESFNYTFKDDMKKVSRVGVMAQDLQKIFPQAVSEAKNGFLKIRLEDMFYALVNAVKDLDNKISEIKNIEITALRGRFNDIDLKGRQIKKNNESISKRLVELERKIN